MSMREIHFDAHAATRAPANPGYDVVIVGAGSAGCLLAARLSADPATRVLLIEAGSAERHPWLRIPAGVSRIARLAGATWQYHSEPEQELGGRRVPFYQGRVMGGSGAINGLVYMRGDRADYDGWRAMAGDEWGWDAVRPFFDATTVAARPGDPSLAVSVARNHSAISEVFVQAACDAGFALRDEFNEGCHEGIGYVPHTIRDGLRVSSASAFLAPARCRANLHVLRAAVVRRVLFRDRRAYGVELDLGATRTCVTAATVVLCAGALLSPALLMRSGVGAPDTLAAAGIPLVHANDEVGRQLQDHPSVAIAIEAVPSASDNRRIRFPGLAGEITAYLARRTGMLSKGPTHVYGYFRSSTHEPRPDLQLTFRPYAIRVGARGVHPLPVPSVSVGIMNVRPESRGAVVLDAANPWGAPRVTLNYLSTPADRMRIVAGIRTLRALWRAPALHGILLREHDTGLPDAADDAMLLDFARRRVRSGLHFAGSCAIGRTGGVVDPCLRVRGVDGLYVADASVMPAIPSANTNAATLMIAERAAVFIRDGRAAESSGRVRA
ncbi:GMC family oxidoreductase [Burkholderia multivorans]|uniref:GMC family oxidoreductase n=1 Tax=Burkholderia multivorans TaxID=87883 RepID=UPI0037359B4C